MKTFFFIILLSAFSNLATAQQERYVLYPNEGVNRELYDKTVLTSFYSMVHITGVRITEEHYGYDFTFSGMSKENVRKLEAQEGRSYDEMPDVRQVLGAHSRSPLVNMYGEDSAMTIPGYGTSYVYPPCDTVFFMNRHFDDFVLKQVLEKDPATGEESWKNETICLRRKLFPNEEPVVVLSFPWKHLYHLEKQYYMPLPTAVSDSLSKRLEAFLAEGERRFGDKGGFQYLRKHSLWQYRYPFFSRFTSDEREQEEWNLLRGMGEQNGVFLKAIHSEMPLTDQYGEDSVAYDAKTDGWQLVMRHSIDSSLYLKSGFDHANELHTIQYFDGKGWGSYVEAIVFVKEVLPDELPLIVYRTDSRKSTNCECTGESLKAFHYVQDRDPLRAYMGEPSVQTIEPMEWETLSGKNRFLGVVVVRP